MVTGNSQALCCACGTRSQDLDWTLIQLIVNLRNQVFHLQIFDKLGRRTVNGRLWCCLAVFVCYFRINSTI